MHLLGDKYYIVRIGDFASDGNKKILYSLFSFGLCLTDYLYNDSGDCFYIMIGSTLIWTIIEFFLYVTNTRKMKSMYITRFNGKKRKIPKSLALLLQGSQEGGVVTTIGLFFGDRLYQLKYFLLFHVFILYIVINMTMKQTYDGKIGSKRQINTNSSLLIMGTITLYNVKTIMDNPSHYQRQCNMFLTMMYISSIWTIIAYYKGFRKVEVHEKDGNHYNVIQNNMLHAFFILGYDVLFEIGIAYLTFYNWFIL